MNFDPNEIQTLIDMKDFILRKFMTIYGAIRLRILSLYDVERGGTYSDGNTLRANGSKFASARLNHSDLVLDEHNHIRNEIEVTAAETLSALRVITSDGCYASNMNSDDAGRITGVSVSSADVGFDCQVVTEGRIQDASWNWQPGPVYLGIDGFMTQEEPATGFVLVIGYALAGDMLLVRIGESLEL